MDRSGSMEDGQPNSKWEQVTEAITSWLEGPIAENFSVALRIWPDPDGCNTGECDAIACSNPQIPLGSLSDANHRQAVIGALQATEPGGETPLSEVVAGATLWGLTNQTATPREQFASVVVTDGIPNGCIEDFQSMITSAATSLAGGVPMFSIGIEGSRVEDMDRLALAGGTEQAYLVGLENVKKDFSLALLDIQGEVLPCTYELPEGEDVPLDLQLVRLEATLDDAPPEVVPRRDNPTECNRDGGWFFEPGGLITLCDQSCRPVQNARDAVVEIAVGCECETDADCDEGDVCEENECVPEPEGGLEEGQNVQGGALNCSTTAPAGLAGLWIGLLGIVAARRRRS